MVLYEQNCLDLVVWMSYSFAGTRSSFFSSLGALFRYVKVYSKV
jgi:hypothetical protein